MNLAVYDVAGRRVRTLAEAVLDAGDRREVRDGRDHHGHLVGPGIYLYRLQAGERSLSGKTSVKQGRGSLLWPGHAH